MFGQHDGVGVFEMPDSHSMAAVSLAATSSGAFTHFETHELIEAGDLARLPNGRERLPTSRLEHDTGSGFLARRPLSRSRQNPDLNWHAS